MGVYGIGVLEKKFTTGVIIPAAITTVANTIRLPLARYGIQVLQRTPTAYSLHLP